jgi:hypothetical protein
MRVVEGIQEFCGLLLLTESGVMAVALWFMKSH